MKILIVSAAYLPTVNGVVKHIKSLKEDLEKMGHDVWILAPLSKGFKDKEKNIIRIRSVKNPLNSDYPLALGFLCPKELKAIKFDIIHIHHPFGLLQIALKLKGKSYAKLFFTNHTQYETYSQYYAPRISAVIKPIVRLLLKKLYKKCNSIICSTEDIDEYVKKIYPKAKTAIIPVGFNDRDLIPYFRKGETRKINKIKDDDFYILYAGRVAEEKNIDLLIKAVKKIFLKNSKVKLVIVGDGDYAKKISQEKSQYIIFCGSMSHEKLASYYQDCDLFASASTTETLGLVFAEAAYLGAPLLGIDSDGVRDVVKNGVNGILAKDENDFIKVIEGLTSGKIKTDSFRANSKESSLPFSATENSKKIEALYKS